jgi:protein-disulfide isomerase
LKNESNMMSLFRPILRPLVLASSLFLGAVALPTMVQAFDPASMSEADRSAFQAEIRAYLLEHPEVIFEAVDIYRAREAAQQEQAAQTALSDMAEVLVNDGTSYIGGNLEGDVTIVEFVDYRCGYCRKAHDELADLIQGDGNIRWVVKELPILGEASDVSSRVALATLDVLGPEAYLKMHNALMTFDGPINPQSIARITSDLGLSAETIMTGMANPAIEKHWDAIAAQAAELAITGTPAFVIGNQLVRGYISPSDMASAVAYARETNQ